MGRLNSRYLALKNEYRKSRRLIVMMISSVKKILKLSSHQNIRRKSKNSQLLGLKIVPIFRHISELKM